jgi:protein gp37
MGSKIEWTEETWNPLIGCDKVSAGCKNCYAIKTAWIRMHNPKMADRYAGTVIKTENGQLNWTGRINMVPQVSKKPLLKKKPSMYFVNSMSDMFHDSVSFEFIDSVFDTMDAALWHKFQILTKRPERMIQFFEWKAAGNGFKFPEWPLPNVWIGVSVEDQKAADERIQYLNLIPAAVKFLSCEPLIGPVNFEQAIGDSLKWHAGGLKNCISWVIVGGESGPGARPMHPDWVRSIRDQCKDAGVPFFFKQWGEWYTTWANMTDKSDHPFVFKYYNSYEQFIIKNWVNKGDACISIDGTLCKTGGDMKGCSYPVAIMQRVGKAKSGRLLDGIIHDEFPTVH